MSLPQGSSIAIIGSGVAGITAAHLLQNKFRITLLEKENRLGGHTNTVILADGPDVGTAIDTGFIVLNNKTYPLLHRLLRDWQCPVRTSDMSFGFYAETNGFYYAGTSLSGLFARRSNFFRPSFYRFLRDILQFGRQALDDLEHDRVGDITMAEYVKTLHPETVRYFIVPMAAAIWSATQRDILQFPAASMLSFWRNHGLLSMENRPSWQTVVGGSHAYLKAFAKTFNGTIRLNSAVQRVHRDETGVTITSEGRSAEHFDGVIVAAHADQALALLDQPTPAEQRLLGAWRYQENRTLLHTDISFLPANRRAWASWNYLEYKDQKPDEPVPVSYWMNLLQGLKTKKDYIVTLNPNREPAPGTLIKDILYHHPVFDLNAVAGQKNLPSLQGQHHAWFCGSYFGHGFHEDAVRSAVNMAKTLGIHFPP